MAKNQQLSGARAKMGFIRDGQVHYVGIFSDVSYGVTYGVEPSFILGRHSAAGLTYTYMDTVHVTANGFRVVDHGWFADAGFPSLSQLMDFEDYTIVVQDRQTLKTIAVIEGVKPTAATGGFSARQLSTSTHTYVGMLVSDESQPDNVEGRGAMSLPS
jgi:hypothetical protein